MAEFTYVGDSLDESATLKTDTIAFGDGYSQRIPTGINNGLRKWNVSFSDRPKADVDAMTAFWRTRQGATSFTWRPQGFDADVIVICNTYSRPIQNRYKDGNFVYSVTATFEEVPL